MLGFLSNFKGGLVGLAAAIFLWIIVYFITFMTAFGNPGPTADLILDFAEDFFRLTNPLWYLPLSYVLGAYLVKWKTKKRS